jgi:hypothetical protein
MEFSKEQIESRKAKSRHIRFEISNFRDETRNSKLEREGEGKPPPDKARASSRTLKAARRGGTESGGGRRGESERPAPGKSRRVLPAHGELK